MFFLILIYSCNTKNRDNQLTTVEKLYFFCINDYVWFQRYTGINPYPSPMNHMTCDEYIKLKKKSRMKNEKSRGTIESN